MGNLGVILEEKDLVKIWCRDCVIYLGENWKSLMVIYRSDGYTAGACKLVAKWMR